MALQSESSSFRYGARCRRKRVLILNERRRVQPNRRRQYLIKPVGFVNIMRFSDYMESLLV